MNKLLSYIKNNLLFFGLFVFSVGVLLVALRINIFRYNNFDYGKFDLGNMAQMLWNTMHGRFMYLTDYFGTNLPRWAMSHVDPILLLFLPIFALFQNAFTLVVSQLVLVIFSSLIVYSIAYQELKSRLAAFFFGLAYLFYPAVGFLIAWTGFHGVTVAIPFFLGAFYLFEKMYRQNAFTKKNLFWFWTLLVITMSGKEQLPLYILFFGAYVWLYRKQKTLGIKMMVVSLIWFIMAFFVIIPLNAHHRVTGYQRFAQNLGIDDSLTRDVVKPNYFLSRYEEFGDSYSSVALGMLTQPNKLVSVFFGGDKPDNFRRTLEPVLYTPFAFPVIFIMSGPDFLINYLTTEGGIGTAEIYNHRISMIVPVVFISSIFGVSWFAYAFTQLKGFVLAQSVGKKTYALRWFEPLVQKTQGSYVIVVFALLILAANIYTSYTYDNPIYQWLTQALGKRIAFAKSDTDVIKQDIPVGTVVRLTSLENKDRECANKIITMIPDEASVSGPDYLGAHLGLRETYAIFPALYNEADYVIIDVFSQKILRILDADLTLVRDVTGDVIKNPDYDLAAGCGNLFVFKKVGTHDKELLLPLQEKNDYTEKVNYEIFQSLTVVDFKLPQQIVRGNLEKFNYVYVKRNNDSLNDYVLFTTFVNKASGEIYQIANLPAFGLTQLKDWNEDKYYLETVEVVFPTYLPAGDYMTFVGMTNNVRTRSLYLGDSAVK